MTAGELQEAIDQYIQERIGDIGAEELVSRVEEMAERAIRRLMGEW